MRIAITLALGAALVVGGTGCTDALTGPSLGVNDPNGVKGITDPGPLYSGVAAGQSENYTDQLERFTTEYMQQVAGIGRQQQGFDLYNVGSGATDASFAGFWASLSTSGAGGGAADARKVALIGLNIHDSLYVGIAKVWEAMIMGDAASIFGAVPYSQAFQPLAYPQPKYDPQLQVLAEAEATLDTALNYLNCATADTTAGSTNIGPTGTLPRGIPRNAEVIFAGQAPSDLANIYREVAHTLKARFYLLQTQNDASNYGLALAQAQLGISTSDHDFNWYSNANTGPNQWYGFQSVRAGDIGPGAALINLMRSRVNAGLDVDNGRLGLYFINLTSGDLCTLGAGAADNGCTGYRPANNSVLPGGGGNSDFNVFNNGPTFNMPGVSWAENELILAEAALQTGAAGTAQTALNAVRAAPTWGADAAGEFTICTPHCTFSAQPIVPATLRNIMEEKYIDLFATIQVYNDYKRTCLPSLAAAPSSPSSAVTRPAIPGRIPYGQTAINSDPNTPSIGATADNADQPNVCPTLTYSSTPAAW